MPWPPTHTGRANPGRSAVGRVRDYYLGLTAALGWAVGEVGTPPVAMVMTAPDEGHADSG